jgi:hypothetical protein
MFSQLFPEMADTYLQVCFNVGKRPRYPCLFDDQYDDDDDYTEVPVTIQEDLNEYIMKTLFPDVLKHMSNFGFKGISGVEINHVSLHLLGEFMGSMEPAFNPKHKARHRSDSERIHRICFFLTKLQIESENLNLVSDRSDYSECTDNFDDFALEGQNQGGERGDVMAWQVNSTQTAFAPFV